MYLPKCYKITEREGRDARRVADDVVGRSGLRVKRCSAVDELLDDPAFVVRARGID